MSTILEVRDVTMRFGGLVANERVNLAVQSGEIFAVIGPNGAGKTTLFNAITGIYEPTEGAVLFDGHDVRRAWTPRVSATGFAVGVASAVLAVLALNVTALWQAAVVGKYVYGQPFPWGEALATVPGTLHAAGFWATWGVAIAASLVGRLGFGAIWHSQRRTPDLIARSGVARTFQNIRLFPEMNLVENVLVGMDQHFRCGFWSCHGSEFLGKGHRLGFVRCNAPGTACPCGGDCHCSWPQSLPGPRAEWHGDGLGIECESAE